MATVKPQTPIINWGHPLTKGLVALYPFFDGGGTLTRDVVGINNGTLSGDYSWKNEFFGTTVNFAGATGKLTVSSNNAFNVTSGTVVCFIRSSQALNFVLIHQRANASQSNGGFTLFTNSTNGFVRVQIKNTAGTTLCDITGTTNLLDGNLHMVVLTFNQASGGSNILYVDGLQQATGTNSAAWTWNANNLTWGTGDDLFWTRLNGNIGPTSWYNRNLSANEIRGLYVNPFQIYQSPKLSTGVAAAVVANTGFLSELLLMGVG